MKAFKKLVLVTAIAAAPFAQAELTAIDDAALSNMTGQAGVSIDLSAQIAVGSVTYTDTGGIGAAGTDGNLSIGQIYLGGSDALDGFNGEANDALDGIKIDIDIDGGSGLLIHLGGTNANAALKGDDVVDFGLSVADVKLNGLLLASDIQLVGAIGPIDLSVSNAGAIGVSAFFKVTTGKMDIDLLGMGVSNLTINQNSNPFMTASPYGAKVNAVVGAGDISTTYADVDSSDTPFGDLSAVAALDGNGASGAADGFISQAEWEAAGITDLADADAVLTGANPALSAGDIIESTRTTLGYTGFDDYAWVAMGIEVGTADYVTTAGQAVAVDSLNITISSMSMDITMDLTLGKDDSLLTGTKVASSLGALSIQDLDLSGTTLAIYGH
ncbi:hypothetical protein A9Q73_10045 [Bermanella sp. 47_1433_sub80_T6]|nr:hypothetical protein A9Q73_10045 [Bermanella sp. 47_1433_sub80_T6]